MFRTTGNNDIKPLPATPIEFGNFLADIAAETGSLAKINTMIAAVADRH